jgi:hemerythrin-like domain-containing protein
MQNILKTIRAEHKHINQVLNILDQQLLGYCQGESADFNLVTDSIDFLQSYLESEIETGERLLYKMLEERNNKMHTVVEKLGQDYSILEKNINKLSGTINEITMDAFFPRSYVYEQSQALISVYKEYIELKEDILLPATNKTLQKNDWLKFESTFVYKSEIMHSGSLSRYRTSLYKNIIRTH